MKYKGIHIAISALCLSISLSACSEHDLTYYQANLAQAEKKYQDCEADFKKAFLALDQAKIQKISDDKECQAAEQAHTEHKRKLAEQERLQKVEEKKKQQELEQAQYLKDVEKYTEQISTMTYSDFYPLQNECRQSLYRERSAKCAAFDQVKEDKMAGYTEALIKTHPKDKLSEYKDQQCKGTQYNQENCDLANAAIKRQKQDQIDYYLANRDALKSTFNSCRDKYEALRKAKKNRESNLYLKTFDCRTASDAAAKLKVYGWSKPME